MQEMQGDYEYDLRQDSEDIEEAVVELAIAKSNKNWKEVDRWKLELEGLKNQIGQGKTMIQALTILNA